MENFHYDRLASIDATELLHLIRSIQAFGVPGYREGVTVASLKELWGRAEMLTLLSAREKIRQVAESFFEKQFSLEFEFTSIFQWTEGTSLEPHYDSNREYLSHRHFTAILYLNDGNKDFSGGDFEFCDASGALVQRIVPQTGFLLLFASGPENLHRLTRITRGKRFTVTVWFSLDMCAREDAMYLFRAEDEFWARLRSEKELIERAKKLLTGLDRDSNGSPNQRFLALERSDPLVLEHAIYSALFAVNLNPDAVFLAWLEYKVANICLMEKNFARWKDSGFLFVLT